MRISDWSSDVCSSDLLSIPAVPGAVTGGNAAAGLAAAGHGHRGHPAARAVLGAAQRPGGAAPRHRPGAGPGADTLLAAGLCRSSGPDLGRAYCRESVRTYVELPVAAVSLT